MGNCVRKDSDKQWGGDYWGSPVSSPERSLLSGEEIRNRDLTGDGDSGHRFSPSDGKGSTTELKIKITKKQLEEILGMTETQGMTVQEVLSRLINGGDVMFEMNQRSWRPALKSIPE